VVDIDCVENEEDKVYIINLEVNEKIPVLYFVHHKAEYDLTHFKTWQIIHSDYTDREIKLSVEAALYKIEIDKEIAEFSYQSDSAKGKIENQASEMALMVEKLAILQNQEKRMSQSKSRFIRQVMFQLSTGMNSVLGFTQLLQKSGLKGELGESVEEVRYASECLLNQMQNALNMSYHENKDLYFYLCEFDLLLMINSLIAIFKREAGKKNIKIEIKTDGLSGYFEGCNDALHLVLFNIVRFIIGSSELPTSISIQLKLEKKTNSDMLVCNIQKSIDKLTSSAVNALEQISEDGSNLATQLYDKEDSTLFISAAIAETIGGKLNYSYEKGVLNFNFQMPITFKRSLDASGKNNGPTKVLFVDDNVLSRQIGFKILQSMDCFVEGAENGIEAIEKIKNTKYDLVLMDCHMPVLDGFDATKNIRKGDAGKLNQEILIIALTASVLKEDRDKCVAAGMNDYLGKPVRIDNVKAMLEKWMKKGSNAKNDK
jgi:CheY-like chemotaxis protein